MVPAAMELHPRNFPITVKLNIREGYELTGEDRDFVVGVVRALRDEEIPGRTMMLVPDTIVVRRFPKGHCHCKSEGFPAEDGGGDCQGCELFFEYDT
jgi:hypothetical protein